MSPHRLFHLVPEAGWRGTGEAYAPDSLRTEGFVHLSTAAQVAGTAGRFFADVDDLLVLHVEVPTDDPHLRWEPAEGPRGTDDFPHYHRALPRHYVVATSRWRSGADRLGRES
ncbi:hypothetical protein AFL01nite_25220 [Aeromicrobium flavum]|uniref:Glutathione S-transferase n=1 Tax=Aeromicrobium flavum TaxID=416568 RepID=A0A512HXL5_9ACTN|nr:DUF952 domain-containing protein [Aeromicrobium flavum]GEO90195.1 hypothetical protein AFL01nite_25220 [Aeromicrobium flavum]